MTSHPADSADHRKGTPARRADAVRNRQAITEAAMKVLAEQPGAGMGEIAAASGLARATLYRHFSGRDDLVRKIQERAAEEGARALEAVDLDEGSPIRAIRRAIRALVGVGDRYRLLAREPDLDPGLLQGQPAVAGQLIALIERGRREGALRDDLPTAWILASMAGLLVLALRALAAESLTAEEATERVAVTLLDGVAAKR